MKKSLLLMFCLITVGGLAVEEKKPQSTPPPPMVTMETKAISRTSELAIDQLQLQYNQIQKDIKVLESEELKRQGLDASWHLNAGTKLMERQIPTGEVKKTPEVKKETK